MLLDGECYENVYTYRRTNYLSFKVLSDGYVVRFSNTRHTVTFRLKLWSCLWNTLYEGMRTSEQQSSEMWRDVAL
jgi:hypothetical protein